MTWYKLIKQHYDWGFYTDEQVYNFARLGKITEDEADTITGKTTDE